MVVFISLYVIGIFTAIAIGISQVSMNIGWEDRIFVKDRERERQDLLTGWRVVKFSWAWPLLIVSFFRALARRAHHAQINLEA